MYISYSFATFYSQQRQIQGEDGQLVLGPSRTRRILSHHNPNSYLYQDVWDRAGKVVNGLSELDGWLESVSVELRRSTPLSPKVTSSCVVGLASSSSANLSHASELHINSFPTELLTTIFLYCLSPTDDSTTVHRPTPNNAPLLLCRVCSFWRRLARATPFLWRELDLGDVRPKVQRPKRQPRFGIRPILHQYASEPTYSTLDNGVFGTSNAPPVNTHHDVIVDSDISPATSTFLTPAPSSKVDRQKLSLSKLSWLAHLFANLSRPLSMKSLKIEVSRYRVVGVKTDFERYGFGDVLYRGGDGGGEVVDFLDSTCGSSLVVPQAVIEAVLFNQTGFVARHIASLDLKLDEITDIPRISIFVSPQSTPTSSSLPFRYQFTLPTLRHLALRMPHLSLVDFEWAPWVGPTHIQLKGLVDLLKFGWGFVPAIDTSNSNSESGSSRMGGTEVEITVDGTPPATVYCEENEGWTTAFSLPSLVPNLQQVELDLPWITLLPGRYGTRGSGVSLHPSSTASILPSSLSILPYAQLLSLSLVRPIPIWAFRALLVECSSLKVVKVRLLAFNPTFEQDDALQQVGAVGGANGDGEDNVGGTQGLDNEYGVYWERTCRRAFGGDPVQLALDDLNPADSSTADNENQFPTISLDALEELHLTLQCPPLIDDRILTDRVRRAERERWPNLDVVFPLPPPFHSDLTRREPGRVSSWMEALKPAIELGETETRLVDYALRGFRLPNVRELEITPSTTRT